MANGPSFTDYVAAERTKKKKVAPKAAPAKEIDWSGKDALTQEVKKSNSPPDLLSTMIDLASRGEFAISNGFNALAEGMSKKNTDKRNEKLAKGDILGAIGDGLATGADVYTAGSRGFFSTDKKDKHYWSENIEKATDTAGAYDPKYKNEDDNVNPWVKGVAGLVGDVALDPINLLPPVLFAKGINAVGKVVKGTADIAGKTKLGAAVGKGVTDGINAAKGGAKGSAAAAAKVAADGDAELALLREQADAMHAGDAPVSTPKATVAGSVDDVLDKNLGRAPTVEEANAARRVRAAEADARDAAKIPATASDWLAEGLRNTPEKALVPGKPGTFATLSKILAGNDVPEATKALLRGDAEAAHAKLIEGRAPAAAAVEVPPAAAVAAADAPVAVGVPESAAVVLPSAQAGASRRVAPIMELLAHLKKTPEAAAAGIPTNVPAYAEFVDNAIKHAPPTASAPNPFRMNPGEPARIPLSEFSLPHRKPLLGHAEVKAFFESAYKKQLDSLAARANKAEKALATPAALKKAEKSDPMGVFQKMIEVEATSNKVEAVLGNVLFNQLKRTTTPRTFLAKITEIETILTHVDRLDAIVAETKTTRIFDALMKTLKIDVKGSNAAAMTATSNVAEYAKAQQMLDEATLAAEAARNAGEAATTADKLPEILESMGRDARRAALSPVEERLAQSIVDPLWRNFSDAEQFPHLSGGGTARTHDKLGIGQGREEGYFNQWVQWEMDISISKPHFKDMALDPTLTGKARALEAKGRMYGERAFAEALVQREGAILTFGTKADAIPLTISQAWELLDDAGGVGRSADRMLKYLYNPATLVPTTNLMDAIVALYRGGTREEIVAALTNTLKRNIPAHALDDTGNLLPKHRADYTIPNALVDAPKGDKTARIYGSMPVFPGKVDLYTQEMRFRTKHGIPPEAKGVPSYGKGRTKPNSRGEKPTGMYFTYASEHLVNELADIVMSTKGDLMNLVHTNASNLKVRIASESMEMTEAVVSKLARLANDPKYLAKALRATAEADPDLIKMSLETGATVDAREIARNALPKLVDPVVTDTAKASVDAADAAGRAAEHPPTGKGGTVDPGAADTARVDAQRAHAQKGANATMDAVDGERDALQKALDSGSPEGRDVLEQRAMETTDHLVDISATTYEHISTLVGRAMQPLAKMFVGDYGMKLTHPFQHSFAQASNVRRAKMMKDLNDLSGKYKGFVPGTQTSILTQAWRGVQTGVRSSDQTIFSAQNDIEKLIGTMFDPGNADSILGNVFFSNPASVHRLNKAMESVGVVEQFDVGQALAAAKKNGSNWLAEAVNQWKNWDTVSKDPLDFVNRMYVAAEQIATDNGVVQSLTRWAKKDGFASSTPREGFVRISASGDSRYADFLDDKLWWDPEIAQQFGIMDKVSRMSRSFDGELGKFIHGPFDLVQGAWKYAITLPRPGHHIRNMVGDMSMTFVAEGTKFYKASSRDAFKILGVRKGYTGLDVNRALESMGEHVLPSGGEVLSRGKFGPIQAREGVDAMLSNGLFNSYHALEDLADVSSPMLNDIAKTPFAKFVGKITLRGGKIEKTAANISEARDHYVRAQHFMQYIHKAQESGVDHVGRPIKDRDALFRMAAAQVKKHHPDGSMLTPFESKVMRRIIPFYSWVRGALPAIVEGALLHPGRNMVFPKTSYALAVSLGLDPYSVADPFPQDQLFPSFLTDQMLGPQFQLAGGEYIGTNPGIAAIDVANMLGPNPVRGIAGAVSPFIRVPAELLSGGSWGTGAKIRSSFDYIDASIPGVNYAANLSGNSVTGSLASMIQGKGLTEQAQVAAGNKGDLDKGLTALNWFTGLNAQNESRPNYQNFAELEKRDAAAAAAKAGG